MSAVNILFLGGAKRVAMAKLFKSAAARRDLDCNIFSSELGTHLPIAAVGTIVEGRRWADADIYEHLAHLCDKHSIDIVVPFVDGAVAVAANLHDMKPEVFVPAASAELSELMFDKVRAAEFFENLSLPVPPTFQGCEVTAPLIAKPRHGSASQGLVMIDSESDLMQLADRSDYLIQQRFDHREEISVDCYVSVQSGEPLAIVPRRRLEVAGGEVVRSITIDSPRAVELVRRTLEATGLQGAVTVQLIHDLDSDGLYIMEINPRLGGGCVCAVHAGADIPGMILDEARSVPAAPASYRPGTEIARYLQEVVFYND